ncbi:MAG: hypothetical protein MJ252_29090 [archaeon]|nr:hypothetical protein [archaeon]
MKAIYFVALISLSLCMNPAAEFLNEALKLAFAPAGLDPKEDPITWVYCANFTQEKEYYTADECATYGVKEYSYRSCCQVSAKVTIDGVTKDVSTCAQLKNDSYLHDSIKNLSTQVCDYFKDFKKMTLTNTEIVCPTPI